MGAKQTDAADDVGSIDGLVRVASPCADIEVCAHSVVWEGPVEEREREVVGQGLGCPKERELVRVLVLVLVGTVIRVQANGSVERVRAQSCGFKRVTRGAREAAYVENVSCAGPTQTQHSSEDSRAKRAHYRQQPGVRSSYGVVSQQKPARTKYLWPPIHLSLVDRLS